MRGWNHLHSDRVCISFLTAYPHLPPFSNHPPHLLLMQPSSQTPPHLPPSLTAYVTLLTNTSSPPSLTAYVTLLTNTSSSPSLPHCLCKPPHKHLLISHYLC